MRLLETEHTKSLTDKVYQTNVKIKTSDSHIAHEKIAINYRAKSDAKIPHKTNVECLKKFPKGIQQSITSEMISVEYYLEVSMKFLPVLSRYEPKAVIKIPIVVAPSSVAEQIEDSISGSVQNS